MCSDHLEPIFKMLHDASVSNLYCLLLSNPLYIALSNDHLIFTQTIPVMQLVELFIPDDKHQVKDSDYYTAAHGAWVHEDQILLGRVNFLIISQSFMISAYYILFSSSYCAPGTNHSICTAHIRFLAGIALASACILLLLNLGSVIALLYLCTDKFAKRYSHYYLRHTIIREMLFVMTWVLSALMPVLFIVFWAHAISFD